MVMSTIMADRSAHDSIVVVLTNPTNKIGLVSPIKLGLSFCLNLKTGPKKFKIFLDISNSDEN